MVHGPKVVEAHKEMKRGLYGDGKIPTNTPELKRQQKIHEFNIYGYTIEGIASPSCRCDHLHERRPIVDKLQQEWNTSSVSNG